jgi:DNA-binding NarL/FixJ family response regulator
VDSDANAPPKYTRVLVVGLATRMLREIVRRVVANESDLAVVAEFSQHVPLEAEVARTGADVVIVGAGNPDLVDSCRHLFAEHPQVKVLAIGGDGRHTVLYELRPYEVMLGRLSPARLLEVIRSRERRAVVTRAGQCG